MSTGNSTDRTSRIYSRALALSQSLRHESPMRLIPLSVFGVLATVPVLTAQQEPRALEREILKQLVEINTSDSARHTDVAAKAMAERLTSAGIPADDVRLIETEPGITNLVARYR